MENRTFGEPPSEENGPVKTSLLWGHSIQDGVKVRKENQHYHWDRKVQQLENSEEFKVFCLGGGLWTVDFYGKEGRREYEEEGKDLKILRKREL